jgi:hypothetical protein
MAETVPESIAAAIAPVIDRLRLAVVDAMRPLMPTIVERTGVPTPALQTLSMLRNAMPDRVVATDDVLEVFAYQPADQVRASLETLTDLGLAELASPASVRLAAAGRGIVNELFERSDAFLADKWAGQAVLVSDLLPLARRACVAAMETGGGALRVVAPPYEVPGASPALLLAELLTPLRFHRFDAHLAAWRAAGLTAAQVQELGPGGLRDQIEQATNIRAAAPYSALDADERTTLLDGLSALP